MDKQDKSLAVSALIIAVSLSIIDLAVGKAGDYAMAHLPEDAGPSCSLCKDNYRLNHLESDIVIVGSSRAARHYVANMLRDSINRFTGVEHTVFNAGVDGYFINSNCCVAESLMDRFPPQLLIFDVWEMEFTGGHYKTDMEFTAVQYNNNPFAKKYVDGLGLVKRIQTLSNMYRFNREAINIASCFIRKRSGENLSGYEPIYGKLDALPPQRAETASRTMDSYSLENFKRVLQTAKERGVAVVVVTSPRLAPSDGNAFLASLCRQYDTPYIDLYNVASLNSHPECFQDELHLNDTGAHLFTALFFERLKPYLPHALPGGGDVKQN